VLAYDDLRTGRLVRPFALTLSTGRAYYFACARHRQDSPNVQAFRAWVKAEVAALDWSRCAPAKASAGTDAPAL
jgi:LysR family glycine cleavage system transcriptional activator